MNGRAPLSAVIITADAEEHLDRVLSALRWCGEIVVLDSGSTDRTREIALEHGAVWITYDPALSGDDVATLAEYGEQSEVLVSPYPGLDAPVVASSWGNQIRLTGADDPDLEAFVVNFKNFEAPEIQANCNDGRGLGSG